MLSRVTDEIRAQPAELARLAGTTLDASIKLGDGWRNAQAALAIPAAAFGNLSSSAGVHRAHAATAEDGETSINRMMAVYEGDVDRLYRVAFAYQQADAAAAQRNRNVGPR